MPAPGPKKRGAVGGPCDTWEVRKGVLAGVLAALTGLVLTGVPVHAAKPDPPKIVYLTFDDGPNGINDPRLMRVLRREQVPATFFVVGQSLATDPAAAKSFYLAGHAIGNHTWSHADLTHLSAAGIAGQLRSTQRLLGPVGGACMRPPYGAVNATVVAEAQRLGLRMVMWDVDPQDWAHQDSAYIVGHVLTHVRNRSIVLMHDGGGNRAATTSAVRQLIPLLRARGYEFRTVPACRVPLRVDLLGAARGPRKRPKPPAPPQPSPTPTVPTPTETPVVVP